MKKLFFAFTLLPSIALAQVKFERDTLYSLSGYKVYKGLVIHIGTGSTPDGDFKFIRRNSTGFGTLMATTDNNSYNKDQFSMPRTYAGHKGETVKIVERGSKKTGYVWEPLISMEMGVRYEIDLDNAIATGEIVVPEEFRPKSKTATAAPVSVADELAKLNKLYKDSILTKEEYDTQKKKLLAQ